MDEDIGIERNDLIPNESPQEPNNNNNSSILDIFIDSEHSGQCSNSLNEEVEFYISYKLTESKLNLFDWWKSHKLLFPRLYKLFIKIAGIPASSAPSERLFSAAGNFLTVKRNRLNNNTLNDLLFMHLN